jgi:hypothetical protein
MGNAEDGDGRAPVTAHFPLQSESEPNNKIKWTVFHSWRRGKRDTDDDVHSLAAAGCGDLRGWNQSGVVKKFVPVQG